LTIANSLPNFKLITVYGFMVYLTTGMELPFSIIKLLTIVTHGKITPSPGLIFIFR